MSDADLVLLPWTRRGAAAGILVPDTFGPGQPGLAGATAALTINGAGPPVTMTTTVMGPGHVTGLDGRQVIRTDPAPGSRTFEPNYFPLVELDEPALPWLFTPAAAGAQARLRPWLCLVVIRQQDGVRLDPPQGGPLPILRILDPARPSAELPDPAETWAWSHAQVTAAAGADLGSTLADPAGSLARLLCSRILAPDTDYLACVVPTFELGRLAGLGRPVTAADEAHLAPAWDLAASSVELPVYYSWTFATGAGGDFQSLAMLLRARPLPDGIGALDIDVGHSGLPAAIPPDTTFPLRGALQPVGATPAGWADPALGTIWESALTPVLNAPVELGDGDPVLAPTLYGAAPGGYDRIDPARPGRWFEQLNLSPAYRAVAHLGTRVVQGLQDQLMASAWAQAAELERANQQRRRAELAARLAASLRARHLAPMGAASGLQVLAPAQIRMTLAGGSFAATLRATNLDPSAFATALRRIARPLGALNRRVQAGTTSPTPVPRTVFMLARLQPTAAKARLEQLVAPPGEVTLLRISTTLNLPPLAFSWPGANPVAVAAAPQYPTFAFVPLGQRVPARVFIRILPPPTDNAAAAQFRSLAGAHLARFNPVRTEIITRTGDDGSLDDAFAEAVAHTGAGPTFAALAGPRAATGDSGAVRLSPRFPQPMSRSLAEIAQGLILPGLDGIPPNTVVPLETDTAFVEAFLAGLNTEMGRELLWRGYPADLAATYFDRFWDASSAPGRRPDIDPIATWGTRGLGTASAAEDFVLLLRSELLLRYPDAVIFATRPGEERHPIFTGGFAPDLRYAGFDIPAADIPTWSIVIMEHPSAPRFGIEVGTDTGSATHLPAGDGNAASVALRARQSPVRITIPATVLLRRP